VLQIFNNNVKNSWIETVDSSPSLYIPVDKVAWKNNKITPSKEQAVKMVQYCVLRTTQWRRSQRL